MGGTEMLYLSGLARASATKSFSVLAGESDLTTKSSGELASSLIGTKSFFGSNGSEL